MVMHEVLFHLVTVGRCELAHCHRVLNIDLRVLYQILVRIARGKPLI